jgi:ABC transporter substrate binding protein
VGVQERPERKAALGSWAMSKESGRRTMGPPSSGDRLPNLLRRAWARCRRPPQGRPGRKRPFFAERKQIVKLAVKYRLPAIYFQKEFVDEGGLMSYGVDFDDLFRRAAHYVDKILKGTKPADLPVQQATKFEFVINLNAAKQIGLTLSPEFLSRANKVIK